ncbi:unnamed protein product, partial [Cladocopium goreaui]
MTDDSASSFSFTNPAAPAGGSQAGTSPSIETDGGTVTGTETSMLNEEITQLRKALYNSEDSVRREELRCLNIWRTSEENAMKIEIAAHDEFVIMNARLGAMTTELQESRQEDEGSTYRIEELERFRDLSEEVAAYINMRYQDLRTEYNEQMTYAQSLIGNIGSSAAGTTDDLRSQLQHAHNRLTYEIENVARLENLTQYASAQRDQTMARMRSEIRMKDSSTKSYELAHSRQETELLKRQLANQEARLSSQVPSVNQEVATLQAQVRQLKGEASELKAKESCRSQAPLALENNSIGASVEVAGYPKRMRCFWNDCEAWEDWLRPALEPETLYRKIEHSQLMKFDLSRYESTIEGDKDRSYKYLIDMIRKHVKKKIGDQFLKAKEKAVMNFVGNPKATPAEGSDEDPPKKPNPKPKAKPAPGGNPKGGKTGKDGDLAPAKAKAKATPALADNFFCSVDGYGTRPKAHRRDPNRPYKLVDMAHFKDEQTRMESSLG